jgi:hypothetical protein
MTKYNPSAPPKTSEKFWVIVLIAAMTIGFCFCIPLIQERISGIKYAPIGQLYMIFGICLLWGFPVMVYMAHRAWRAQTNRSLTLRMLAALIVILFIAALPHQINLFFAQPGTHEVSVPVKEKSRQLRTPRSGNSFLVYRLHFDFDNVQIAKGALSGEHIVFVSREKFDSLKEGDDFLLLLKTGPLASFTLQTENTVNLMR